MKIFDMDRKIKLLCLVYFMVAQSSMMARATSDSFLLKYFEVESIPLMIMAAASLSIVLAIFTTYLCGRFQAYGAMKMATAGLVVALVAIIALVFFFGAKGETKSIYVFAYMLCEVIVILPMVLFWGMAVGVLNPTESKKWMGMIGAAGTCGCILAGYTISFVSKQKYVNELSLGLVAAVLLVVSFILIVRAKLLTIDDDEAVPSAQSSSILRKLAVLISSRQSVLMTGLVVFSAVVLSLIDINFKFEVRDFYSDKSRGELYDFFGQFYTYTSIAQLILQLLVVRAILTRGGVWAAISILPVLLLLTSAFALVVGDKNAVYMSKFVTQVVFFTIEYVGLQMLFLSVKKKMRGQMNSAVDGLTRPATIAAISLLITSTLPFWQEDTVFRLNSIIICLCCIWLFVSFLNYRQYLSSLVANLKAKIIKRVNKDELLTENTRELREVFLSANEDRKQLIGELLAEGRFEGWLAEFRELLKHDREALVLPAIRYLCEYGDSGDFDQILERALLGSITMKLEFLRSSSLHASQDNLAKLAPLLDDSDSKVRFSCSALLRSFDHEAVGKAEEVCGQFIESGYPEDRLLLVDCLSSLENLDNSFFVDEILATADDELNFAPGLIDAKSLSKLSEKFAERLQEGDAEGIGIGFLERIGEPAQALIEKQLSSIKYEESKKQFTELLRAFVRVAKPLSRKDFSGFIDQVTGKSDRERLIFDYFEVNQDNLSSMGLKAFAKREFREAIKDCGFYLDHLRKLAPSKPFEALKLALETQLQLRLKTLISIMPVFNNEIDYRKLMSLISAKEANVKAEALEVLKGILGPKTADQLISVFLPYETSSESTNDLSGFVKTLGQIDSRWILAGLLLAFSEDDFSKHEEFVKECLANHDGLVRETALHVYVSLQTDCELVEEQCQRFASDPSPEVAWIANDRLSLT
jgi:hypothetical protein